MASDPADAAEQVDEVFACVKPPFGSFSWTSFWTIAPFSSSTTVRAKSPVPVFAASGSRTIGTNAAFCQSPAVLWKTGPTGITTRFVVRNRPETTTASWSVTASARSVSWSKPSTTRRLRMPSAASTFSSAASSITPLLLLSIPSGAVPTVTTSSPAPPAIVVSAPVPRTVIVSSPPPAQTVTAFASRVPTIVKLSAPSSPGRPSARRSWTFSIPCSSTP